MKNDEILQAAKEAGLLHPDAKAASRIVFDFAAIIEKRMIERCASLISYEEYDGTKRYCFDEPKDCVAAIRKLGEQ